MSFVKICGTTSLDDALLAHAAGADAVGFVFAASPRRVDADTVAAIVASLPDDLLTVGVFRGAGVEEITATVARSGVGAVQLHGDESAAVAAAIRPVAPFLVQCFTAADPRLAHLEEYPVDAILVDGPRPGSGETVDWSAVAGLSTRRRLLLAGGLTADNVAEAVARVRPWGVDVVSGVEASPGRKDPLELQRFVAAARKSLSEFSIDPGAA